MKCADRVELDGVVTPTARVTGVFWEHWAMTPLASIFRKQHVAPLHGNMVN